MFFEDLFCHVVCVLDLNAVVDSGEYRVANTMFSCLRHKNVSTKIFPYD